jgi:hypothetical protein
MVYVQYYLIHNAHSKHNKINRNNKYYLYNYQQFVLRSAGQPETQTRQFTANPTKLYPHRNMTIFFSISGFKRGQHGKREKPGHIDIV